MKSKTAWPLLMVMLHCVTMLGFCPVGHNASVFGLSLENLISPEQAAALLAGEKPVLAQSKEPRPRFVPRHEVLQALVEALRKDLDPNIMVETLHIYKKPPEAEKAVWSAEEFAALYNNILALSTLTGLQYYSVSRSTMRTFYETSSIIDGPSSKRLLLDPVYQQPPAMLSIYARQKDLTFGDNIYQYDYYVSSGAMIFIQQNLTTLSVGIIPAVGKNKLRSAVAVLDAGEYLLVYAASMAKAASLPGMNDRLGNSFSNRAEAIFQWFSNQADKAFKKVR